jgi:hypothetical protein
MPSTEELGLTTGRNLPVYSYRSASLATFRYETVELSRVDSSTNRHRYEIFLSTLKDLSKEVSKVNCGPLESSKIMFPSKPPRLQS